MGVDMAELDPFGAEQPIKRPDSNDHKFQNGEPLNAAFNCLRISNIKLSTTSEIRKVVVALKTCIHK